MDMTEAQMEKIGSLAGKAAATTLIEALDERIRKGEIVTMQTLKTKFELVLAVDCSDEAARDRSRAAFQWLANLDRTDADKSLAFVK